MEQNSNNEIDLIFLYRKFLEILRKWNALGFRALNFVFRKWIIIISLVIIGVGLGYYKQTIKMPSKKAKILLRINFDAVNYVYTSVELFNNKIADRDSAFFVNNGFKFMPLEVREMIITPKINIKDIIEKYEENDRNLEAILRNLDFDEEDLEFHKTFTAEYKYHYLDLRLSSYSNQKTIEKVLTYINNNEYLKQVKNTGLKNIIDQIAYNDKMIRQLDQVIDTYQSNESLQSASSEVFVVDKNFSISSIFETKIRLQEENNNLKNELIYSKEIAVIVNNPNLSNEESGFIKNEMVRYPILFIFLFLFLALAWHIYNYLKQVAFNTELEESKS